MASLIGLDENLRADEDDGAPAGGYVQRNDVPSIGPPPPEEGEVSVAANDLAPCSNTTKNDADGVTEQQEALARDAGVEQRMSGLSVLDSAHAYVDKGLVLTWMPSGTKAPNRIGWNTPAEVITTRDQATARLSSGPMNIGLVHKYSGTCAIDIDDVEKTKLIFGHFGLDYDSIISKGMRIWSKENRDKVIFQVPSGLPLHKISWPRQGATKSHEVTSIFELRAGENQDVLPPSTHPDGHDYQWWPGRSPMDFDKIPEIPAELVQFWQAYADPATGVKDAVQDLCPWKKEKSTARVVVRSRAPGATTTSSASSIPTMTSERCSSATATRSVASATLRRAARP